MRVNARYINSTRGTSSKKESPPVACIPYISGTLGDTGVHRRKTGVHRHKTEPVFIPDERQNQFLFQTRDRTSFYSKRETEPVFIPDERQNQFLFQTRDRTSFYTRRETEPVFNPDETEPVFIPD